MLRTLLIVLLIGGAIQAGAAAVSSLETSAGQRAALVERASQP